MNKISAVIITHNEEANLGRCLKSIAWVDEIIVVDSGSTDRTREIAHAAGAKVMETEWCGFGPAKSAGLEAARGEWILSLDADEEVSVELAAQIKGILNGAVGAAGYRLNRKTQFLGRWITHGGWYPDRVLRLFRKDRGHFNDAPIHEQVILDGPTAELKGLLLHYSYPTLEFYLAKSNRYTTIGAEEAWRQGKNVRLTDILLRPAAAFFKHYIARRGFLDGYEGFLIAALSAQAVLVKYSKLRHLWKSGGRGTGAIR